MSPPERVGAPPATSGAPTNVIALHGPHRTRRNRIAGADLSEAYALLAELAPRIRLSPGERLSWLNVDVETGTVTWGSR